LKIGDRIYVNGQWSGTILYIGETTLGSGDWVGVILDDSSLGKTNGIVRGRCYFQTTNNRGIFCRLTKVTREKIL
jgi:dynactin complex subunit